MKHLSYKIVWIASMPRSGSMWAFNVTRALLRGADLTVLPESVPRGDGPMLDLLPDALADSSPENIWCFKVHQRLRSDAPSSRFISTRRDPRDAVISFMRFIRCDFEHALAAVVDWTKICDHFGAMPADLSLCLDYDTITTDPIGTVTRIGKFLCLPSRPDTIAQIAAEFERETVRRRIKEIHDKYKRGYEAGDEEALGTMIGNADGTYRVIDAATGFQSHHVSDYQPGDWRAILTKEQKGRLDAAIGDWLARYGYSRRLDV
jgi:hypothetical protein